MDLYGKLRLNYRIEQKEQQKFQRGKDQGNKKNKFKKEMVNRYTTYRKVQQEETTSR